MNVDLQNCVKILQKGGTMLYPTDTIWGLGCDVSSRSAIDRILEIKQISHARSMIILVTDVEQLSQCVEEIPPVAFDLMEAVQKPLTIIFPRAKGVAKHVSAADGSVGVRLVKHRFCLDLIAALGSPIVSTSANMTGQPSPINFHSIDSRIVQAVDYVVDFRHEEFNEVKASQIIKLDAQGMFTVIRD